MASGFLRLCLLFVLMPLMVEANTSGADQPRITSISVADDTSGELRPGQEGFGDLDFRPIPLGRYSFGSSDSAHWLHLRLENPTGELAQSWLEVGQARLRHVSLYERVDDAWRIEHGGTAYPFSSREVKTLTQVFSVNLPPESSREVWVRVASDTVAIIHPRLWNTNQLLAVESHNTQLEFFMAGAVVLMLLFGVAATLILREPGFLLFGLATLCFLLFRWSIKGVAFREFWPDSPQWALQSIGFFQALLGILILALHRSLLQTSHYFPRMDRILILLMISFGGFALAFLTALPHRPLMHTMSVWGLGLSLLSLVLGYYAWRKGMPLWGYVFAAYALPWHTGKLLYFSSIGWFPALPRGFTDYAMAGSTLLASLVILAGLGERIARLYREQRKSEESQRAELQHLVNERTAELFQTAEVAQTALAEHRQFLAMVSHELRSPIASISSACQLLESRARETPQLPVKVVQRIRRAVARTRWFLDNLLAEDRFESQHWQPRRMPVALRPLLDRVMEQARHFAPDHRFSLEVESIPADCELDAEMLRIALGNLLENAAKYADSGTTVKLHASTIDDKLRLTVVDQGPGIPEEQRSRIFDKYVRLQESDTVPGTGMGLFIVRRVADLHEGSVSVGNNPDGGLYVQMEIPIHAAYQANAECLP